MGVGVVKPSSASARINAGWRLKSANSTVINGSLGYSCVDVLYAATSLQIPVLSWFNNRTHHISTSRSVGFTRPTLGAGTTWHYQAWMNCHFRKVASWY